MAIRPSVYGRQSVPSQMSLACPRKSKNILARPRRDRSLTRYPGKVAGGIRLSVAFKKRVKEVFRWPCEAKGLVSGNAGSGSTPKKNFVWLNLPGEVWGKKSRDPGMGPLYRVRLWELRRLFLLLALRLCRLKHKFP